MEKQGMYAQCFTFIWESIWDQGTAHLSHLRMKSAQLWLYCVLLEYCSILFHHPHIGTPTNTDTHEPICLSPVCSQWNKWLNFLSLWISCSPCATCFLIPYCSAMNFSGPSSRVQRHMQQLSPICPETTAVPLAPNYAEKPPKSRIENPSIILFSLYYSCLPSTVLYNLLYSTIFSLLKFPSYVSFLAINSTSFWLLNV